jgi:hypothetical protein
MHNERIVLEPPTISLRDCPQHVRELLGLAPKFLANMLRIRDRSERAPERRILRQDSPRIAAMTWLHRATSASA